MSENHIQVVLEELAMLRQRWNEAIRERVEYRQTWLEWLEANDSLTIEQWLLAYSDATPEPTESEDDETICGYIDRRMREAAAEIKRLREERDEARRECDYARREVCVSLNGNMKQAHEYATYRDWDCFKEETQ